MKVLKLSPSVGVARLGNSTGQFCLSPDKIGGLPFEADQFGNKLGTVKHFKDEAGQIRRQGQLFRLLDADGNEITLNSPDVESITWTVHLANKKAAWYQFSELKGNLLFPDNSYAKWDVDLRNKSVEGEEARQKLIVDPGPRTISGRKKSIDFSENTVPSSYKKASFPEADKLKYGTLVESLGDLKTDDDGRLVVLGGFGHAGGNEPLTSYGGSDTWHDDISDGSVHCEVVFKDGSKAQVSGWVIVGSPDYVPEIVNISTLSDTMFDVGVRNFDLMPDMFNHGKFNPNYKVNYQRDILPIIQRLGRYQWVANVQAMVNFTTNIFDYSDPGEANKANRMNYFSYFREPNDKQNPVPNEPQSQMFKENGDDVFPMMPLNSGSNSVSNDTIEKFLALDETQYYMMKQWAEGNFENNPNYEALPISYADMASVGNCVGLPMCPGIEVTWSLQNPVIYSSSYQIMHARAMNGFNETGLTPSRDECEGGGCEPGDLTKRMACPWQADFFQCTVQYINFTNPDFNKDERHTVETVTTVTESKWKESGLTFNETVTVKVTEDQREPLPPTYYSYWWPPQSPWDVLTGEITIEGQQHGHLPAGQQVNYARGINSFVQMVEHWSALAFIRDNNSGDKGFPYFAETERNHELFSFKEVPVSQISGNQSDDETTIPVFFIEEDREVVKNKSKRARLMVQAFEKRAFKAIRVHSKGLGLPRSGTRSRR